VEDLTKQAEALRQQVAQVTALSEENHRLSDQLRSAAEAAKRTSSELAQLRAQVGKLRQLEQEIASLKSAQQSPQPTGAPRLDDGPFDGFFGPGSNARVHHAKIWGYALISYAEGHLDQFPVSLQDASSFLGPDDLTPEQKAQTAQTADQFEMLYQGRREDMTNPPPEGAIMLREKQPWRTAKGEWARAYVYGNGGATIHTEPDGNFDRWEGPRIPKSTGP
jgi:small-conductance mechanosensitive channel